MTTLLAEIRPLLLTENQAGKFLLHNEALIVLSAYRQVLSQSLAEPPATTPATGDAYIVAAPASGAWVDHDDEIAYWFDGGWRFLPPLENLIVGVVDVNAYVEYLSDSSPPGWGVLTIGSGISAFTGLSDTPSSYGGQAGKGVRVKGDESGLEFAVNVSGPGASTDHALPRFDGTTGALLQASGIVVDDDDRISGYNAQINEQTGTTYTLQSSDRGKVVRLTNASPITLTVPNSLVVGFCCTLLQGGAGQVTVIAGSGATVHNRQSHTKIAGQYGMATLLCRSNSGGAAAVCVLAGDTAT